MDPVKDSALTPAELETSLTLYVTETDPSPIERRSLRRWILLALLALFLHLVALYFSPRWYRPLPPPPIEVQQIDPAKLDAIKRGWKERGFLLSKDPNRPKTKESAPKDARYESDRNHHVEKETRARQTNVIPNVAGNPNAKAKKDRKATKARPKGASREIPLSDLSNFKNLPVPGPRAEEEQSAERRGGPGQTGDQALFDRTVPEGAENMLNTVESVYYSFYSRMYEQIGPLWQSILNERVMRKRPPPGDYVTQAEIIFDSDGNFVAANILSSSGIEDFDTAIPAAWRKVPRFPNPPRGLIERDGKIHMGWTFDVHVDERMQWQYMPPQREY
jgi:outer membrane biosynthesis protein TonB